MVRDPEKLPRVLEPFGIEAGRVEIVAGDVLEPSQIEAAAKGCDAAIHCAGFYSHEPHLAEGMCRTNVEGTENVLTGALRVGLDPVVHVSSMLAMFPSPGHVMRTDDPVTAPRAPYARSKADAERVARRLQDEGAPVVTVYPGSMQGPHDPTVASGVRNGPHNTAMALRTGRVLVTEGGLVYTDARDLAGVLAALMKPNLGPRRYLFGGSYLTHAEYHALLCDLTGRALKADRFPGALLRLMGWIGDLRHRVFGTWVELDGEAAWVLTRTVPLDDAAVRQDFGIEPMPARESFRDLLRWMFEIGMLDATHVGALAATGEDLV
jgi:UDP-glucose 4-epimerase